MLFWWVHPYHAFVHLLLAIMIIYKKNSLIYTRDSLKNRVETKGEIDCWRGIFDDVGGWGSFVLLLSVIVVVVSLTGVFSDDVGDWLEDTGCSTSTSPFSSEATYQSKEKSINTLDISSGFDSIIDWFSLLLNCSWTVPFLGIENTEYWLLLLLLKIVKNEWTKAGIE